MRSVTSPDDSGVRDDSGASLIFALAIITVSAITVAVLLSFTDTSVRTTIALRSQASQAAAADGAASLAINQLRHGTYDGTAGRCFTVGATSSDTLTLTDFYQAGGSPADSAAVTCENDTAKAAYSAVEFGPANTPRNAALTMAGTGEDGLHVQDPPGRTVTVHGSVFANSTVTVPSGAVGVDASLTARGACTGTISSVPAPNCSIGAGADSRGDDPDYPAPTAPATPRTVPVCVLDNELVTFTPGLYTDITSLNNMTRCLNTIFYFPPGTYYFNFPDSSPWLIDTAYLVAGTPTTPLVAGTPPTIPGACRSPVPPRPMPPGWTPPPAGSGVSFVFGGGSRMVLRNSQAEICGEYADSRPPIAIYGLKAGASGVPAQTGCVTATPYPTTGCALIRTESQANSRFYVQGTVYAPRAALDIALNNRTGAMVAAGLITRTVRIAPTAAAVLTDPVIEIPDPVARGRRTVLYLNVYLCPGSSTCSPAAGTLRIRAKVGIVDPSGTPVPGARAITVYSWSLLR